MTHGFPEIRDLAIIGDRRIAALITKMGTVVWYCPGRSDSPSLFAALLDQEQGGSWILQATALAFASRHYLADSGVLKTTFTTAAGEWQVTDWMPIGENTPTGICRLFSSAPDDITVTLHAAPDYARRSPLLRHDGQAVQIDQRHYLYASHVLTIVRECIQFNIPSGETGWAVLVDKPFTETITNRDLDTWLEATLTGWQVIAAHTTYQGLYEREITASLRALRLLTFEENGGIIAALTTSLPEVIGGKRNYDHRYIWLRDAGMITSALTRAGSDGTEERRFLEFVCRHKRDGKQPLMPFSTLDGKTVLEEEVLPLMGYCNSNPVVIGNSAKDQLQLDAYGNILLAAKLIYSHFNTREHWSLIEQVADFLADHWHEPDHGLWEEKEQRQYTSSKVIVACGLNFMADLASPSQGDRWHKAAQAIRQFVTQECLNSEGAYAAVAGGEAVDVSAALFPVWAYTEPDTPEMVATMKVLERDYAIGQLYHRHLEEFDSHQEGAFLAGTFWVAQYWLMRHEFQRVYAILDATLEYANDLGFFAEEADPCTKRMLGNFPQTFAHAAFIGVVIDLKEKLRESTA